jgi:hypothetical protein
MRAVSMKAAPSLEPIESKLIILLVVVKKPIVRPVDRQDVLHYDMVKFSWRHLHRERPPRSCQQFNSLQRILLAPQTFINLFA